MSNKGGTITAGFGGTAIGGRTTITDYSMANKDKVSLASCLMGDVSGVTIDGTGATLTFGGDNDSTIDLANIAKTDTVTFRSSADTYGTGYVFENDRVRIASGRGVTLITAETAVYTLFANNGTLTGGTQATTRKKTSYSPFQAATRLRQSPLKMFQVT